MNPRSQPLLLAGLAAAVLGLGSIGWLARDLSTAAGDGGRRSLLDLLDEVGQPPGGNPNGPAPQPAPKPPRHPSWRSPLAQRCAPSRPAERQRLARLVEQLRRSPQRVTIDPTNYGERFNRDAFGNPLDPTPRVVVLHETVYGMSSAINTFRTPHPRDEDQVSYHALVGLDGSVVLLLDPSKRAFGAGNSAFRGQWAVTNPSVGGSVNNFALHISLETPIDGEHDGPRHSGYTAAQYDGLAALLALWMQTYPIPADQITTHRAVDLGGERADPRSFDWAALQRRLSDLGLLC
ncbi:MAG: peptidoglycan recognition family protein [Cyanobacteriota bacterium]|nr:peptidoglycan recognition family protein [Cyanobacteriota bacterium]